MTFPGWLIVFAHYAAVMLQSLLNVEHFKAFSVRLSITWQVSMHVYSAPFVFQIKITDKIVENP